MDIVATTQQPSKLCPRCAQFDLDSEFGFCHHDFTELKDSASNLHCPLCQLFYEPFRSTTILNNPPSNIDFIPRSRKLGYKFFGLRENLYEIVQTTELSVAGTSNERRDNTQVTTDSRLTSTIPLDDQNMAIVNQWLRSCSMEHDRCKQTPGFISPTRLLHIGGPQLRLVSSRERNLRYTILSHCWGKSIPLVTTEASIALFHQQIDWSAVPATFKDAITTSRKLNIEYLWIDSLCIIQDSRIDWEIECQNMAAYYKNAYLTLSVLDSPSSDTGFLHPRKSLAVKLSNSNCWIRPVSRPSNIIFQESCLNKRGWTLQERLLSTRVLHFSNDELLWECQTCSATESSTRENHEPVDVSSLVSSEGQDFKRGAFYFGPDPYSLSTGVFAVWYRIVKQYSRRSLTYESDRLPAISGIARFIGQRTGFTYLAGIWQQDPHGLVWCIDSPGNRISHQSMREHAQPVDIGHPSWSWAKMRHSVSWRFYEQTRTGWRRDAKILQSKIVSKSSDPYGAIQTAEIELEALTLDVQCTPYIREVWDNMNIDIYHEGVKIGGGRYDDPRLFETTDCMAVYIAERVYVTTSTPIHYFLLVQHSSQDHGAWERIGMGMTVYSAYKKDFGGLFEVRPKEVIRLR